MYAASAFTLTHIDPHPVLATQLLTNTVTAQLFWYQVHTTMLLPYEHDMIDTCTSCWLVAHIFVGIWLCNPSAVHTWMTLSASISDQNLVLARHTRTVTTQQDNSQWSCCCHDPGCAAVRAALLAAWLAANCGAR